MLSKAVIRARIEAWRERRRGIKSSRTKLGMAGYAHLSAILADTPMTAISLGREADLGHVAPYRFLMAMHGLMRVHIVGWEQRPHTPPLPIFAWGHGDDAEPPAVRRNGRTVEGVNHPVQRVCKSITAFAALLQAIERPAHRSAIVQSTGLDKETVTAGLEALCWVGLAHIAAWSMREHGGAPIEKYQLGGGADAPKPGRGARAEALRLPPGVRLAPDVKITIAPPLRDRFAPDPGFERVITGDYMLRRQGAAPMHGSAA